MENGTQTFFLSLAECQFSAGAIPLSLFSASRALTPLPSSAPLSLIERARRSVWLVWDNKGWGVHHYITSVEAEEVEEEEERQQG